MIINNIFWRIESAPAFSPVLRRSNGTYTIGMTDGARHVIYIASHLRGALLDRVMAHELVHAFMFSYNINIDIEQEEFMADWVSLYGRDLIYLLDEIMLKVKDRQA